MKTTRLVLLDSRAFNVAAHKDGTDYHCLSEALSLPLRNIYWSLAFKHLDF